MKLGEIISHKEAANIIGKHFPNVKDKLLNTLQLKQQQHNIQEQELIKASIQQKTDELKPVPFTDIIQLSKNRKYLKYAFIPLLIILTLLITSPNIIKDSTVRIIKHMKHFDTPAPFIFNVLNKDLEVLQFNDLDIQLKITGDELPERAYIIIGDNKMMLNKSSNTAYQYTIKNLHQNVSFQFMADEYYSKDFDVNVLPKPLLVNFDVTLDYPYYLNKKDEVIKNIGDLDLPQGTKTTWNFYTKNASTLKVMYNDNELVLTPKENKCMFTKRILRNASYTLYPSNTKVRLADSIRYFINVIPDQYPSINVEQYMDSMNINFLFFTGDIKDDYGFSKLLFRYKINNEGEAYQSQAILINQKNTQDRFYYSWNLKEINIKPKDELYFFFEVWDNDGVNGSKFARTPIMTIRSPSTKELEKISKEQSESIKEDLAETIKATRALQEEMKKMQEKLLQKKSLSWDDKKALEEMLEKQKALQQKMEDVKMHNEKLNKFESDFKEPNQEILEKEKMLQELFEEVFSDEMKELIKKFEDLLEKTNKENVLEELEDMQLSNEDLAKELDRLLELFKQFEFEKKLNDAVEKLQKLAVEQNQLAKETKEGDHDTEELKKEQQDIQEKFEDITKKLDEMREINQELEWPNEMEDFSQQEQDIQQEMQESQQQLGKNNKSKASKSQQQSSQKMQEMAEQLSAMKSNIQMSSLMLDLAAVRQVLENLLSLSFKQEDLIGGMSAINTSDPKYKKLIQDQFQLKDEARLIEDSLFSLSKRIPQIKFFVTREIGKMNDHMSKTIDAMADRNKGSSTVHQQYTMTSVNNLLVMMSEILETLQQQMASQCSGTQMCQKPGNGKQGKLPSQSLGKLQQQLNQQIEQIKKSQQSGSQNGMSKELAKAAAKQAAIRNALQKLNEQGNKDGKEKLGNLEKLQQQMEQTETDLANKRLTEEMIERQKEIMVKLLEAEEALREREESPERKAEKAKDFVRNEPPSFKEYKKMKEKQVELYKTVPPSMRAYYKRLVELYFNALSF